jgi:hypothetical protein
MDKWLKDILPDKDPYHNRGRDQIRKKGVRNSSACDCEGTVWDKLNVWWISMSMSINQTKTANLWQNLIGISLFRDYCIKKFTEMKHRLFAEYVQ